MKAVVGALYVVVGVFLFFGPLGYLLYRWSRKVWGSSREKWEIVFLSFCPILNICVWFPLTAGKECFWPHDRTGIAIFCMICLGGLGWFAVISTWLWQRRKIARPDTQAAPAE